MKVGLDVRHIYSNKRGFGRLRNYLEALFQHESDHQWILFGDQDELLALQTNWPEVTAEPPDRRLRMMRRPVLGFFLAPRFRDLGCFHFPTADVWYSKCAPTVVTLHDLAGLRFPERFFDHELDLARYKKHLYFMTKNADRLVTVSRFAKNEIVELLDVQPERITVIYQGYEPVFQMNTKEEKPRENFFLYCGGLDFRKNVDGLIRAYSHYRHKLGGDWRLVITGESQPHRGKFYPDLKKIAAEGNVREWVDFTGWIEDSELRNFYRTAGAFVFPSLYEGFGYPPLEAMSAGLPVLCSKAAALPETVGEAALLKNAENPEEFAQGMMQLSREENLQITLRENGRNQLRKYSWSSMAEQHIDLYEDLAREAGRL
jgi:glycosyltransferase involved in cell wall biosynthesis